MNIMYLVLCFTAFLFSVSLAPMLIHFAYLWGTVDKPDGQLKNHTVTTPYLGGLTVGAPFLLLGIAFSCLDKQITALFIGSLWLLVFGLIDDLIDLCPGIKIIGQSAAVGCFLVGGIAVHHPLLPEWLAVLLTILWMLTVINAHNLIDVMDGLTSVVSLVAAGGCACFCIWTGQAGLVILLALFIGSVCGFFIITDLLHISILVIVGHFLLEDFLLQYH